MIPKKIYSTWISDKPVPQKFEKYIESWKRVMPDYEVHIISMENVKHGTFVDKAIAIKNYALAGHYARVQELYENGSCEII
jgi:mannosyltransferase OCH1-like enzyme